MELLTGTRPVSRGKRTVRLARRALHVDGGISRRIRRLEVVPHRLVRLPNASALARTMESGTRTVSFAWRGPQARQAIRVFCAYTPLTQTECGLVTATTRLTGLLRPDATPRREPTLPLFVVGLRLFRVA